MFLQPFFFQLIPSRATFLLLACTIFFWFAGQIGEADASSSALGGSAFSEAAAPTVLPLALGSGGSGSRDREALATRNVQEVSPTEQLLQGSVLGALFFAYPYKGLSSIDLVVMGLLLVFVLRLAAARRRSQDQQSDRFSVDRNDSQHNQDLFGDKEEKQRTRVEDLSPPESGKRDEASGSSRDNAWSRKLGGEKNPQGGPPQPRRRPETVQENAAAMWSRFSSQEPPQNEARAASVAAGADIPAGFDAHEFLEGARALYVRLQQAWASRKVDDLAPFISTQMLNLLQKQAAADPDPVPVEILLVDATLNKVLREGQAEKAEVAFSVVMRTGREEESAEVNETWLFARGGDFGDMWQLTGIRQA
jgi:hypothetical protein